VCVYTRMLNDALGALLSSQYPHTNPSHHSALISWVHLPAKYHHFPPHTHTAPTANPASLSHTHTPTHNHTHTPTDTHTHAHTRTHYHRQNASEIEVTPNLKVAALLSRASTPNEPLLLW